MATKLIVMTGFLIAFAAGLVTGMQNRQVVRIPQTISPTQPSTTPRTRPPAFFIDQLKLTREQSEKWNKIWSEVADRGSRGQQQRVTKLRQEREGKIQALIPEADRVTYDRIQKDFADAVEALDKEWRDSYDEAVARTKEILDHSQRQAYETILRRNDWDRGRGGPGPRRGVPGGGRSRGQGNPSDGPRIEQQTRQADPSATTRSAN